MRLANGSFIAAVTLALAGQAFAVEKRPCVPGEQEVMAKDRTTMCVKAYGARPESKGGIAVTDKLGSYAAATEDHAGR